MRLTKNFTAPSPSRCSRRATLRSVPREHRSFAKHAPRPPSRSSMSWPIHAVEDDANPPFLVMEIIDGVSLQDKLDKKGPLPVGHVSGRAKRAPVQTWSPSL